MNEPVSGTAGHARHHLEWGLTLFGTAVGIGILYLPILAGLRSTLAMLIIGIVCFPAVWLAHRLLTRMAIQQNTADSLPGMLSENMGAFWGLLPSLLYSLLCLTLVTICATAIINISSMLIESQLGLEPLARPILSLMLALGLSALMLTAGEKILERITALLAVPLIGLLLFLSFYLIPWWDTAMLSVIPDRNTLITSLLLLLPLFLLTMDFSPVCPQLAATARQRFTDPASTIRQCDRSLLRNSLILLAFVLFFCLSAIMATPPATFLYARQHNLDILSLISMRFEDGPLYILLPALALATLLEGYCFAFLGARKGLINLISLFHRYQHHDESQVNPLQWITTLIMTLPLWIVAFFNPSILLLLASLAAPLLALLCYVLPVGLVLIRQPLRALRGPACLLILLAGLLTLASPCLSHHF